MVAEHDVGDGAVALDAADELRALLRMELHGLPFLVGQLAVGDQDGVGEDELADVVEQAGGVDELLLALGETEQALATSREYRATAAEWRAVMGSRIERVLSMTGEHSGVHRLELVHALDQLGPAGLGLDD